MTKMQRLILRMNQKVMISVMLCYEKRLSLVVSDDVPTTTLISNYVHIQWNFLDALLQSQASI